ncbi:MAG: EamA family transporter [Alphaproteobacteria bacterium]|nr:EamA family transporter [Alphaproteobacteria bacterium]
MRPARWRVLVAYAAIYLIWGSTYLAIARAVESIPPAVSMGVRSVIGGAIMLAIAFALRARAPSARELGAAAVVGTLFFAGNHGLLAYAQQRVPTGVAALLIATIPFFVPLLTWAFGERRPPARVAIGIAVGLAGVAILVNGRDALGRAEPSDAAITLLASFCWSLGTVLAMRLPRPASLLVMAGTQLVIGGAVLCAAAALLGQFSAAVIAGMTTRSLLGVAYLLAFGTFGGFGAYVWLMRHEPAARIATYAFVNPMVAVLIGHLVDGEPVTAGLALAMTAIVGAVILIVSDRARRPA